VLAFLALLSGASPALGQDAVRGPTPRPGAATSSIEEGQSPLDESFDFREFRLKKRREAFKDTTFEINFRTFYFDRHKFDGSESQAWAIGGWAGLKTGYFLDHIAFGLTAYTSQPLYAPDDKDGTLLLEPGQEGYTVLGEAYADIRIIDGLNLYVGRKAFDTPYINRNDVRMTPNTFEAIALQGRWELDKPSAEPAESDPGVNKDGMALSKDDKEVVVPAPAKDVAVIRYGVGYFDQIKERNSDDFVSMAVDAGAPVERGVFTGGAIYEKGKLFSIGAIDYYSADIINIGHAEAKVELPLSTNFRPRLAVQFTDQRSVGDNLLEGDSFSTQQFGIKAELPVKQALFTIAYTNIMNGAGIKNPWSANPGYTSVQVQEFNRAGESALILRAGYEFPWVEGLSAYALGVFGTTPSPAGQFRQDEYDFNLQWTPPKGCLKGLQLRLRYAIAEQHGGDVETLTDFRAICNYVIKF
jgi:hypothetical protein